MIEIFLSFIFNNLKNLPSVKFAIGVGGAFDFITEKIKNLKIIVDEKRQFILDMKDRLDKISNGELDHELLNVYNNNKKEVEKKRLEKNKKKQLVLEDKSNQKIFLQKYY